MSRHNVATSIVATPSFVSWPIRKTSRIWTIYMPPDRNLYQALLPLLRFSYFLLLGGRGRGAWSQVMWTLTVPPVQMSWKLGAWTSVFRGFSYIHCYFNHDGYLGLYFASVMSGILCFQLHVPWNLTGWNQQHRKRLVRAYESFAKLKFSL